MSSPTQPRNVPCARQPEPPRLALELGLGGAGAGDDEAHVAEPADHRRERVEREVEALLVDEPADEQHEPLVGRGEARAQAGRSATTGSRSRGSIPFGITVTRRARRRTRRDVAAHVVRARDHAVGAPHHRALDGVDVRLGVVLHPALVAAVLGRVDGHQPRAAAPARDRLGRAGDEPVVGVDEVEARTARTARPRARACRRSSSSTQRDERVESSFGNAGSRTRWTITPWRSSSAGRRPPPRVRTWTSTPSRTSCSESLRTWRARPPSIDRRVLP